MRGAERAARSWQPGITFINVSGPSRANASLTEFLPLLRRRHLPPPGHAVQSQSAPPPLPPRCHSPSRSWVRTRARRARAGLHTVRIGRSRGSPVFRRSLARRLPGGDERAPTHTGGAAARDAPLFRVVSPQLCATDWRRNGPEHASPVLYSQTERWMACARSFD